MTTQVLTERPQERTFCLKKFYVEDYGYFSTTHIEIKPMKYEPEVVLPTKYQPAQLTYPPTNVEVYADKLSEDNPDVIFHKIAPELNTIIEFTFNNPTLVEELGIRLHLTSLEPIWHVPNTSYGFVFQILD